MPKTTRPTPKAAATATRMIAVLIGGGPPPWLVGREVPAAVDVFRPDSRRRRPAWTLGVGLGRRPRVVRVRLEDVLHEALFSSQKRYSESQLVISTVRLLV